MPRALRGKFFVEVFSGTGRLSLALIGQDVQAQTFDIIDGPDSDLLRAAVRRRLYSSFVIPTALEFGMVSLAGPFRARGAAPPACRVLFGERRGVISTDCQVFRRRTS